MLLTNKLPESVEVGGTIYPINTDFRAGIEFEVAKLTSDEDLIKILTLFFGEEGPEDIRDALEAIVTFYRCGEKREKTTTSPNGKRAYSFEADEEVIFSDFLREYNIDLSQASLHWWAFRALLSGLSEKSEFKQRVYYRTCDLAGMPKKERERIMKIRSRIAINTGEGEKLTLEERNAKMKAYALRRQRETAEGGRMNG